MTMTALKAHPKVYWIWNHRRWCLENIPDLSESDPNDNTWKKEAWDRELFVVEKMLDSDPRNCMFLICGLYNVCPLTLD
jgi:geranylgeranyl transferase type-2 subunit alpha